MTLSHFAATIFDLKTTVIVALVFIPLERILPLRREQKLRRAGWSNDVVFLLVNGAFVRLLYVPVVAAVVLFGKFVTPATFTHAVGGQALWLQAIELILLADLATYAVHRLFHAIPFLWRFHAVHHSIEELDWLASFRVHPVDQVITAGATFIPMFAFGFSPWAIACWGLIFRWQSLLLHSNINLPLGRLGLLIATPEFHHWHHSTAKPSWDKNFSAQVALWDLIFGTLYLPKGKTSQEYGIEDRVPGFYVDQLCYPFRKPRIGVAAPREPAAQLT